MISRPAVPRKDNAPVSIRIRLKYPDLDTFIEKYAANISQGGMFIQSRAPQPVGTTLRFEVLLADGSRLLKGEGKVIWVREYDAAQPTKVHGMGVKFLELDDESQSVVSLVLAHKGGRLKDRKKSATQEVQALEGEVQTDAEEPDEQAEGEPPPAEEPAPEGPALEEPPLVEPPPEEHDEAVIAAQVIPPPKPTRPRPPDRVDVAMAVVDSGGDGVAVALANADHALGALMDDAGISDAQVAATISRALTLGVGGAGVEGLAQLLEHDPPPPVDAQTAMEALNQTLGASVVVPPPRWEKPPPLVAPTPEPEPEKPVASTMPAAQAPQPEPDDEPITIPARDEPEQEEPVRSDWDGEGEQQYEEKAPEDLPLFDAASEEPGYEEPGYEEPGYEEPGYEEPGYVEPGDEERAFEEPEPARPGYEQPEYEQPEYGPLPGEDEPIAALPSLEDEIESAEPPDDADLYPAGTFDGELPAPEPEFDPTLLEAAARVSRAHDPEHVDKTFDLSEESTVGMDDEVFAAPAPAVGDEPPPRAPDGGWKSLKTATKLLDHETSDVLLDLAQRSAGADDGYHEPLGDFSDDELENAVTGLPFDEGDEADQLSSEMWREVQREAADLSDPGSVPVSMADPGAEPVARIDEPEDNLSIHLDDFDDSHFEVEEETQVSGAPSFDDEVGADPAADLLPADNIFPSDPDLHDEVFDALAGLKDAGQEHVPADVIHVEPIKSIPSDLSVPSLDDLATVAQASSAPEEMPSHPVDLDDIHVIADDPEEVQGGQDFKPRKSGIFRRLFGKKKE